MLTWLGGRKSPGLAELQTGKAPHVAVSETPEASQIIIIIIIITFTSKAHLDA